MAFGSGVAETKIAVDVEVIVLIEAGAPGVHAELEGMGTFDPSQAVGPLKAVAHLREGTFPVVSELRTASDGDIGNTGQTWKANRA